MYQAELKKKEEKKNKKKEKVCPKNVTAELGAMFESNSWKNESSCSSDSSDEDFCIVQKEKEDKTIFFPTLLKNADACSIIL